MNDKISKNHKNTIRDQPYKNIKLEKGKTLEFFTGPGVNFLKDFSCDLRAYHNHINLN